MSDPSGADATPGKNQHSDENQHSDANQLPHPGSKQSGVDNVESEMSEPGESGQGAMGAGQSNDVARIPFEETPFSWRVGLAIAVVLLYLLAHALRDWISPRGQAGFGIVCFIGLVATFSSNLRAVNWRTLLTGMALQCCLALFILRTDVGVELFRSITDGVAQFLNFSSAGATFVFGLLANPVGLEPVMGPGRGFIFAFAGLPVIIFVSSFFTVLYYLGVLQLIVRFLARAMMVLLGTSGAESLSSAANVFMGQTEAPLIVKPYVKNMTQSELLALMVGGMATISGGLMAVYIQMGADRVAILATSVMAAPCGLYLAKLLLPETEEPITRGMVKTELPPMHRNIIDAAAGGASDGLFLALNVAAMLIAFLAFLALIDHLLGQFPSGHSLTQLPTLSAGRLTMCLVLIALGFFLFIRGVVKLALWLQRRFFSTRQLPIPQTIGQRVLAWGGALLVFLALLELALEVLPPGLSMRLIFSAFFAPLAFLMGVPQEDVAKVANLLGIKLVSNEFVAYTDLTRYAYHAPTQMFQRDIAQMSESLLGTQLAPPLVISNRAFILSTFALTGFANFGSVGILLGGVGAMAPERRADLARLGGVALFGGFMTTLLNAAFAGLLAPLN